MRKIVQIVFVAGFVLMAGLVPTIAHKGASGIVKERMDMMKSMGDEMKALKPMATGEAPLDVEAIAKAARLLKDHAGHIPHMFPKGSDKHPSEAKKAIWTQWAEFESATKAFLTAAKALEQAGASKEETAKAFQAIAKACKSCHQDFRKEKKKN